MSVSFFSVSACDLFGYVPKSRFQTAVRAHTGVKHSVPEADLACPDMYQKTQEKGRVCVCVCVCFVYYRCNRKGPNAFVILFSKNIISCWYTLAVDSLVFISKWNQVKSWQSIPTFTFCVTITFYCVCLTWATVLIKEICFYLFSVQSFFLKSFFFLFIVG